MQKIEIIPAIDLIGGKCVRLTRGDYATKKVYEENPVRVAREFEEAGIRRLHLVDLDGARVGKVVNHKVLEGIATQTNLHIDFGGGIKSDEDIRIAFNSGAKQVTGGSIAVMDTEKFKGWLKEYGSERIILGADVRDEKVSISGWSEDTTWGLSEFLEYYQTEGIRDVICTDISRDGVLEGPAIELYSRLVQQFPKLRFIASGGVSCLDDIQKLQDVGLWGVILGKAIYEKRIEVKELVNQFIL